MDALRAVHIWHPAILPLGACASRIGSPGGKVCRVSSDSRPRGRFGLGSGKDWRATHSLTVVSPELSCSATLQFPLCHSVVALSWCSKLTVNWWPCLIHSSESPLHMHGKARCLSTADCHHVSGAGALTLVPGRGAFQLLVTLCESWPHGEFQSWLCCSADGCNRRRLQSHACGRPCLWLASLGVAIVLSRLHEVRIRQLLLLLSATLPQIGSAS